MSNQELINFEGKNLFTLSHVPKKITNQWGILLLAGLGENLSDLDYFMKNIAVDLCENNIFAMQIDLTGHGESDGDFDNINERILLNDIENAVLLMKRKGYKKIGVLTRGYLCNLYTEIVKNQSIELFIGISPIILSKDAQDEINKDFAFNKNKNTFIDMFDSVDKSNMIITMLGSEPQNLYTERINERFWNEIITRITTLNSNDVPKSVETIWFSFDNEQMIYKKYYSVKDISEKTLSYYHGYAFPRNIQIESFLRLQIVAVICRRVMKEI